MHSVCPHRTTLPCSCRNRLALIRGGAGPQFTHQWPTECNTRKHRRAHCACRAEGGADPFSDAGVRPSCHLRWRTASECLRFRISSSAPSPGKIERSRQPWQRSQLTCWAEFVVSGHSRAEELSAGGRARVHAETATSAAAVGPSTDSGVGRHAAEPQEGAGRRIQRPVHRCILMLCVPQSTGASRLQTLGPGQLVTPAPRSPSSPAGACKSAVQTLHLLQPHSAKSHQGLRACPALDDQ